jgi:hypothetical protein
MAFKLNLPGNGTGAAPLPAGKSLENCAFRNRETIDFDAIGWVCGGSCTAEVEQLFSAESNYGCFEVLATKSFASRISC